MESSDYFQRMNYQGSHEPTLQTLQALHEAHLRAIPFENLSIHAGQPILLHEQALYEKIVHRHRGGFCYELNGLFAWLLRHLGFRVTLLSAEVAQADGGFTPAFDHLTLLVHDLDGADRLADVGFGDSFRLPLRLEAEVEQEGGDGHTYRLRRASTEHHEEEQDAYWVLQRRDDTHWQACYRFTLEPQTLSAFTPRCRYQQTSPESHFTQRRICSKALPAGRITLSDLRLITTRGHERDEHMLSSEEEYAATLKTLFGIVV
jgi:N-hydroxyarylamine O-acetyltransferase